jgi:hypothetical protein
LRSAQALYGASEKLPKMVQVFWYGIAKTPFELAPDEFIRVEFRGVSRESLGVQPRMGGEESFNRSGLVDRGTVPKEDNGAFKMPK